MKKIFYTALLMIAFGGCQEVIDESVLVPENVKFTADIEALANLTKTSMDSQRNLTWSKGDQVAIFHAQNVADKYQVTDNTANTAAGEFEKVAGDSQGDKLDATVAVYPYTENLTVEKVSGEDSEVDEYEISGFVLPETQTYVADSFGEETFPMAAITKSNGLSLGFKNLLGAVKLQLVGTEVVKSIKIKGKNGERLSGAATITVFSDNQAPLVRVSDENETYVTLDCGAGVQLNQSTPTTFIMALPPVKFKNGFIVQVFGADGKITQELEAAAENEVFRSSVLAMPTKKGKPIVTYDKLTLELGEPELTRTSISVSVKSPGAGGLYYWYTTKRKAQNAEPEAIIDEGQYIDGEEGVALLSGMNPASKKSLAVVAVDKNGMPGPVESLIDIETLPLVYNDLVVTIEDGEIGNKKASFPITITGGAVSDVIFWVGKDTDEFWTLSKYCGKDQEKGQKFMALYPDDNNIVRSMSQHSYENGILKLNSLAGDKNYILLVMAKDAATGEFSKVGLKAFHTMPADLGTVVVTDSDKWKAAKDAITINWHEEKFRKSENSNLFAFYAFDFSCPSNMTAYVSCMSEDYYFGESSEFKTMADRIIEIENYCSRKYQPSRVPENEKGELIEEPNWVDDNGNVHTGFLMTVYDYYVHGYPRNGFATYFAAGSHGEDNCTAWEATCETMVESEKALKDYLTLDYWIDRVKSIRGRDCTKPDVIRKSAQDLYDAYYPYYKDSKPLIYFNEGQPLYMEQHNASGPNDDGVVIDAVVVVLKDLQGNYYEPMVFNVPNAFK